MPTARILFAGLVVVPWVAGEAPAAPADAEHSLVVCTQIKTIADLQGMINNLAGVYCLANDIDAKSVANFAPIGDPASPFTGGFFGNHHVIRNLKINSSQVAVGLFGATDGAVIQDVGLVNASVLGSGTDGFVGGLVGVASTDSANGTISRVFVTGQVQCTGDMCSIGGIAGGLGGSLTLADSWSSAKVTGNNCDTGGVVGIVVDPVTSLIRTYATGSVTCGVDCIGGGLVGRNVGTVSLSYATGPVTGDLGSLAGGLIGENAGGTVEQSYAAGTVAAAIPAGLIGNQIDGAVIESFAVGRVVANGPTRNAGRPAQSGGGLIAGASGSPVIIDSYWDKNTTGRVTSEGGFETGKTTAELRAALPPGFGRAWGITKTLSYPFFNDPHIDFASTLATTVTASKVFAYVPISQFSAWEYLVAPNHATPASLAAVYTMIARAIGLADNVPELKGVKIDKYFWNDSTQTTTWTGPVTAHAALGAMIGIPSAVPLDITNVIGRMNTHQLVILRGTYTKTGVGLVTHYMLGTLYTQNADNSLNTVVANDPATGLQVEIDPATKKVISPANFPLANFTVNGYRAVAVH